MQPKGVFCISLDFELHWGVFDKKHLPESNVYFEKTRELIPLILNAFEEQNVHCTWATVGALSSEDNTDLQTGLNVIGHHYNDDRLDPAKVIVGESEEDDPYHFAPSLIEAIRRTKGQEVGTHTFSHFYTLEKGATLEAFTKDLELSKIVLLNPRSIVFPRNQYNVEVLKLCSEHGIEVARSNPEDWFWKSQAQSQESFLKKVFRTLDHYWPLGSKTSFSIDKLTKEQDKPLLLPASRFFRPPSFIDKLLPGIKVKRIKGEMTYAAKKGHIYHLWWHPHNFAVDPQKSLKEFNTILKHYAKLQKVYNFRSLNMGELFDLKMNNLAQTS